MNLDLKTLAATVLLLSPSLAAVPSSGGESKSPDTGVSGDLKAGPGWPAGVNRKTVEDRRDRFRVSMDVLAGQVAEAYGQPVRIQNLFFALSFTDSTDAAVVVFKVGKDLQATVFVFTRGEWDVLPTDFGEAGR